MEVKTIDLGVLLASSDALTRDFGSLGDLSDEMRNTLANVYYKFHLLSANFRAPSEAFSIKGDDFISSHCDFMVGQNQIVLDYKYAAKLLKNMREIQKHDRTIFELLQTKYIAETKYRIENAGSKSPIRLAIEKRFRKVDEIPDLYSRMLSLPT